MKVRGFIGQTLLLMGGQGLGKVFSFVSFMIIARLLGPGLYGSFTFALTFGSLLAFIPNMGADPFYCREVPTGREKEKELLGVVLILKIAGSVVFFLIYTGCIFLTTTSVDVQGASFFIGTAIVLLSFSQTWKAVLITSSRAGVSGLLDTVQSGVFLLIVAVFVSVAPTVIHASEAFLTSQITGVLLGALTVWRIVGLPQFPRDPSRCMDIFKKTAPLALIWLLNDLYLRVDTAMLYYLKGDTETGFYAVSYRLVDGVCSASFMVCSTALPRLSQGLAKNIADWRVEWGRVVRFLLIVIFIPVVLFTFVPETIIRVFYGTSFSRAVSSLRILGIGTLVLSFGLIYGIALTSIGKERSQLKISLVALIVNVLLNSILIPSFGGVGAAIATLISGLAYIVMAKLSLNLALKEHSTRKT